MSKRPNVFKLCDLTQCPYLRYLQVTPGKWAYRYSPTPPGVAVCHAKQETWDAARVPQECPYLNGTPKPWGARG